MGLENPPNGIQRSRRNLINMGAIAASAIFAGLMKTTPAAAGPPGPPPGPPGPPPGPPGPPPGPPGPPPGPPGPPPGPSCFLKGTTIRTADGDSTIEDLAVGDLLPVFSAEHVPSTGSAGIRLRRAIRQRHGSKTYSRFGSLGRPLVLMCRMPIYVSRRDTHCSSMAC